MTRLFFLLAVLLALAGGLAACSGGTANTPTVPATANVSLNYTNISPSQLNTMLANKDFVLVNVHIPYYAEIAGTDLFIPYDQIQNNLAQLPPDKNAKIVLYCRSGSMSTEASGVLAGFGYSKIYNLSGGMYAWEAQGYLLLRKPQPN